MKMLATCPERDHSADLPVRDYPDDACERCGKSRLGGAGEIEACNCEGSDWLYELAWSDRAATQRGPSE